MSPDEIAKAIAEGKKLAVAWKGDSPIYDRKVKVSSFQMRRENALGERLGHVRGYYDGKIGRYEAVALESEPKVYGELVEAVTWVDGELEAQGYRLQGRVIWR